MTPNKPRPKRTKTKWQMAPVWLLAAGGAVMLFGSLGSHERPAPTPSRTPVYTPKTHESRTVEPQPVEQEPQPEPVRPEPVQLPMPTEDESPTIVGVNPGGWCGDDGALGTSDKGRVYVCLDGHWRRHAT